MFCNNCGAQIPDNVNVCPKCGTYRMEGKNIQQSASKKVQQPNNNAYQPTNNTYQNTNNVNQPANNINTAPVNNGMYAKKSKSSGRWAYAILAVGFIIFIGIMISSSDDQSVKTAGAIDNTEKKTTVTTTFSEYETVSSYIDSRIPNYVEMNPQWDTVRFEWDLLDGRNSMWLSVPINTEMYAYYSSLDRYYNVEDYYKYINDENNSLIIRDMVSAIKDNVSDLNYNLDDTARELAKFVQDVIEYQYDIDGKGVKDYPKYPIETLYEGRGDCEDTSILMAAMLKELNYEVGLLYIPGHIAVVIRTEDDYSDTMYYEYNGHRYLFIESTGSGWNIGYIPDEYKEAEAQIYLIP